MNLEKAIATILKRNRLLCGLSQEELAIRCDLDRTYISLLERGLRKPTINVVFKLCNNLNIKASEFIFQVESVITKD